MKRKKAPIIDRVKKKIGNLATNIKDVNDYSKKPIRTFFNKQMEKWSQTDTSQSMHGTQRDRYQYYDEDSKRFIKVNSNTGEDISKKSQRNEKFKHVKTITKSEHEEIQKNRIKKEDSKKKKKIKKNHR